MQCELTSFLYRTVADIKLGVHWAQLSKLDITLRSSLFQNHCQSFLPTGQKLY